MMTPPMVGVPALTRWVDGRSSWIRLTERTTREEADPQRRDEQRDEEGHAPGLHQTQHGDLTQKLARDGAIVEGHDEVADGLGRLVSLAGHDDDVTRRGLFERARDRASPVGVARVRCAPLATPDMTASMIDSGDSERGLSDVTIVTSENVEATRPISGRLARSRSPPQPNTVMTRPSGVIARTSSKSRRSPSGVCA